MNFIDRATRNKELNQIRILTEQIIVLKKIVKFSMYCFEQQITQKDNITTCNFANILVTTSLPKNAKFSLSWEQPPRQLYSQNEIRKILSAKKRELKEHQKSLAKIDVSIGFQAICEEKGRIKKIEELDEEIKLKSLELEQLKSKMRELELDENDTKIIRETIK